MADSRRGPDPAFLEAIALVPSEAWVRWLHLAAHGGVRAQRPELQALLAIPGTHGNAAIAILSTRVRDVTRLHQLAVRRWPGAAPEGSEVLHAQLTPAGRPAWALTSAWADPVARGWLWEALSAGASLRADGWTWEATAERASAGRIAPYITSAHPAAHPAHDLVLFPPPGFVIMYRELTPGGHIELDVLRHLEESATTALTPSLLGHATLRAPDGVVAGAAVLQAADTDAVNASDLLAERLGRALTEVDPSLQAGALEQVRSIGVATRTLHAALGWPFGHAQPPQATPATAADVDRWTAGARAALTDAYLAANTASVIEPEIATLLHDVGEKLDRFIPSAASAPGVSQRIHGALTLDNVLLRPDGTVHMLGFSGDPWLPPEARRQPQSPWRDVARLLYSLTLLRMRVLTESGGDAASAEIGTLWEREARKALLDGYGSGGGALHALTSVFEVELACATLARAADAADVDGVRAAATAMRRLAAAV
jgi:predicted trehalose synthase